MVMILASHEATDIIQEHGVFTELGQNHRDLLDISIGVTTHLVRDTPWFRAASISILYSGMFEIWTA